MFRSLGKTFTHKIFSVFGIKIKFITPEYKLLKKRFKNIRIVDVGRDNRIILAGNPCQTTISGGGATMSL